MKLVIATCPTDQAQAMARSLVKSQLVACINIIPKVVSIYKWNEDIVEDSESILIMKTSDNAISELKTAFHNAHPYDVPEFIALDVNEDVSSKPYLGWVYQIAQGLEPE